MSVGRISGGGGPGAGGAGGGRRTGGKGKTPGRTKAPGRGKGLKGSTLPPSPERILRTTVKWFGTRLPSERSAEYGERFLPLSALATKEHRNPRAKDGLPILVYFSSDADERKLIEYERSLWKDERVGIASRFFNCYRIDLRDVPRRERKAFSKKGEPSVILLDADGKKIKTLRGWRLSGDKMVSSLGKVIRVKWRQNLEPLLAKEAELLKDMDELHEELDKLKRTLTSTEAHVKEHNCKPGKKRLARTKEKIAEAEKRRKAVFDEEKKLLGFSETASKADATGAGTPK